MFNKIRIGLLIVAVALAGLAPKACSSRKDQAIKFARIAAKGLRAAAPIIEKKSPTLAAKALLAATDADELATALAASNSSDAIALLNNILPVFTDIVRQFAGDSPILQALAYVQIALNWLVDTYISNAPAGILARRASLQDVAEFKALPQFGCQYLPDRCK